MVHVVVIRSTREDEAWELEDEEGRTLDVSRRILVGDSDNNEELKASDCVEEDAAGVSDSVI